MHESIVIDFLCGGTDAIKFKKEGPVVPIIEQVSIFLQSNSEYLQENLVLTKSYLEKTSLPNFIKIKKIIFHTPTTFFTHIYFFKKIAVNSFVSVNKGKKIEKKYAEPAAIQITLLDLKKRRLEKKIEHSMTFQYSRGFENLLQAYRVLAIELNVLHRAHFLPTFFAFLRDTSLVILSDSRRIK